MNAKRPLAAVPLWLRCLLPAVLVLHMGWHAQAPTPCPWRRPCLSTA